MSRVTDLNIGNPADAQPEWRTPVLSEDSIADSTRHYFNTGIDNYESTNPVQYGIPVPG
jgi:hypothetical protein